MYKLIIGTVRITVSDDSIKRDEAASAAKQAIQAAERKHKLYSHIEIARGPNGLSLSFTEKTGAAGQPKDIRHSMLSAASTAVRTALFPTDMLGAPTKSYWIDQDSGREWRGYEVENTRKELLASFEAWLETVK